MENAKDKSSRSGSKSDLNESSLPLLEGDDDLKGGDSKVTIEMDTRSFDDKSKEDNKEVAESDGKDAKDEKSSKKKKKEKKEKKEKAEKKEKGPSKVSVLADRLTAGLNLLDRDDRNVNDHVNIMFEDVLAEPDGSQGFDAAWRLAFIVFSSTKLWVYRIFAAILAIPCGLLWGIVFSILTLLNVWLITPLLRTINVILQITHKLWASLIQAFMDPVFQSVGQLFSSVNINKHSVNPKKPSEEP